MGEFGRMDAVYFQGNQLLEKKCIDQIKIDIDTGSWDVYHCY
jgi:hypothetical protein